VGHPFAGVAWRYLLEHSVDLLERKALGLGHQEVGEENADDAEGAPHEEDLGRQVGILGVDQVRGDDGDDAVPEPVAGC